MSASLNKVMLIGTLGKDPEVRTIPNGTKVANFSMATNKKYKDKNDQWVEKTEWHSIVIWRGLAEVVEKYLVKGSQVYIEGELVTRSWENAEGNKIYRTEIVAGTMNMLGGKRKDGAAQSAPQSAPADQGSGLKPPPEDDLPF